MPSNTAKTAPVPPVQEDLVSPAPMLVDGKADLAHDEEVKDELNKMEYVPVSQFATMTRGQALKLFWRPVVCCIFVSFGAMMDGYHNTIDGNIIANQGFINQFGTVTGSNGKLAIDAHYVAMWGGIYSGCTIFANLIGGFTADWFGRRFNMWVIMILLVAGTVTEILATNYQHWAASKVFCGVAAGFYTTSLVIYNSEIAPAQIRGFLLATWALGNGLGQLVASVGLQILATSNTPLQYKNVLYSEFLMEGLFLIGLFFIPESPVYYCRKALHDKAKKSLLYLHKNIKDYDVEQEYNVLRTTIENSKVEAAQEGKVEWIEIVRGTNLRRFLLSMSVPVAGKLSGATVIFGYTSYFFSLAGLSNPFLASMILYIVQLLSFIVSFYTLDKVGRRPLLLGAMVVLSIANFAVGICGFHLDSQATKNGVIVLACIWITAYASGLAPVGPSYQGESSTLRLRAKTNSMSQAGGQMFGLIFNYTVPLMLADKSAGGAGWGVKTTFFFGATNTLLLILYFFQIPEYRGKTYAELDELFLARTPARKFRTTKTSVQMALEQQQGRGA